MKTTDTLQIVRLWLGAIAIAGALIVWTLLARTPFPQAQARTVAAPPEPAPPTSTDPKVADLQRREAAFRARAARVQARQQQLWAEYRSQLATRREQIAAAQAAPPAVRIQPAQSAPAASASTRSS